MKKYHILALLSAVLLFGACGKDEDNLLQLDGENSTGPQLEVGQHETAVRFSSSLTGKFEGKKLTSVLWFTGPRAVSTSVKVYGPGTNNGPGTVLYNKDVSSSVRPFSWNEHVLDTPVSITGEELWIGIAFTHSETGQTLGCDAGPNKAGGDWLFTTDGQWRTYIQRTGESVNWNIRGKVGE